MTNKDKIHAGGLPNVQIPQASHPMPPQSFTPPQEMPEEDNDGDEPVRTVVYDDSGYEEYVILPSRGMYYPANHPLHRQETVAIRQITSDEENILTSKTFSYRLETTKRLLASLILDGRISPDSLVPADRDAILLQSRITAYGSDYEARVSCPTCGQQTSHTFDLQRAAIDARNALAAKQHKLFETGQMKQLTHNTFALTLLATKWPAVIRIHHSKTFDEYLMEMQKAAEQDGDANEDEGIMFREERNSTQWVRSFLISLNEISDPYQLDNFRLPAKDMAFLRDVYRAINPALILRQSFTCSHCHRTEGVVVPIGIDFFRLF
jgi:hypothetical protein